MKTRDLLTGSRAWRSLQSATGILAKHQLAQPLLMFVVARLVLLATTYWLLPAFIGLPEINRVRDVYPDSPYFSAFFRWDSFWYLQLAAEGYAVAGGENRLAFFPLFPLASRALGEIVGDVALAGLLLSNTASAVAVVYIYKLARLVLDEDGASRAVLYYLVFPTAFFHTVFYSEGLFTALAASSLYFFSTRRYLPAAFLAALASATRVTGVVLAAAYVVSVGWSAWRERRRPEREAAWLLLAPAGLVAYMAYMAVQWGDPFAFVRAQSSWGASGTFPLATLVRELSAIDLSTPPSHRHAVDVLDSLAAAVVLVVGFAMVRRSDPALWLIVLAGALMPLASGRSAGMLRYASAVVPLYVGLALLVRGVKRVWLVAGVCCALQALLALRFFKGYWAG